MVAGDFGSPHCKQAHIDRRYCGDKTCRVVMETGDTCGGGSMQQVRFGL